MFNPNLPIPFVQENIDKIINIKNIIAEELDTRYNNGEVFNIQNEWNRLFNEYISQDPILSLIENIDLSINNEHIKNNL